MTEGNHIIDNKRILAWTVPAELESWDPLRTELFNQMTSVGISKGGTIAYLVAIEELFVNIVFYAYTDEPVITDHNNARHPISVHKEKEIQILFQTAKEGEKIKTKMVLMDTGKEFDPLSVSSPDINANLKKRIPGGLGIFLARERIDHIQYQREGHNNVLTLIKTFSMIK